MPAPILGQVTALFQSTFERQLEATAAGRRAFLLAEARDQTRGVEDAEPTEFVPGFGKSAAEWVRDEASQDYLGNEFLLWLWFVLETESETLALDDGSGAAIMVAQSLILECPRGQTGRQTLRSDNPTRLPEARQARSLRQAATANGAHSRTPGPPVRIDPGRRILGRLGCEAPASRSGRRACGIG